MKDQPVRKVGCFVDVDADLVDDPMAMNAVKWSTEKYIAQHGTPVGDITTDIMTVATQMVEGVDISKRRVLVSGYVIPHEKKEVPMEPTMNITNQINAGLNDVRETLVTMSRGNDIPTRIMLEGKAKYQLELIVDMIDDSYAGKNIPWSDRKLLVEEEFS